MRDLIVKNKIIQVVGENMCIPFQSQCRERLSNSNSHPEADKSDKSDYKNLKLA